MRRPEEDAGLTVSPPASESRTLARVCPRKSESVPPFEARARSDPPDRRSRRSWPRREGAARRRSPRSAPRDPLAEARQPRDPRAARRDVFWLAYFDFFSIRGERILTEAHGPARAAIARDAYTYLHFPMIVGIVLSAFAMKIVIAHVGDELDWVVAFALCGGSAIYLLTYSAIRIRVERRWRLSRGRFTAAVVLLLLLPIATMVPALAALALVMLVWLALHTYELVWWRQARAESRSALTSS
jgi:hypothetical protein